MRVAERAANRWRWFRLDGREIDAPGCDWCGGTFGPEARALFASDAVVCSVACAEEYDAPRHGVRQALVCSWCSSVVREGHGPPTHGICSSCSAREIERNARGGWFGAVGRWLSP